MSRKLLAAAAALACTAGSAHAQFVFSLTDGLTNLYWVYPFDNPNANCNLTSGPGTVDQMSMLSWYYRTPLNNQNTQFSKWDTPTYSQPAPNQVVFTWTNAGPGLAGVERFNAQLTATLTQGLAPGQAIVDQVMVFQAHPDNTATRTYQVFVCVDEDLGGVGTTNVATKQVADASQVRVYQDTGTVLGQPSNFGYIIAEACNRFEVNSGVFFRQKLYSGAYDLIGSTTYTGDASTAFQWSLTLAPGESRTLHSKFSVNVDLTAAPPCYANCDGSQVAPLLNAGDFACFLDKFRAGNAYANCDGSTGAPLLTATDFVCFLGKFRAGCP